MATGRAVPLLIYDDLDFIPQERAGDRHELFDGELVVTPSPVPSHRRASSRVHDRFAQQALAGDLGESFFAAIDVVFAPNVVASPLSSSSRESACRSLARRRSTACLT